MTTKMRYWFNRFANIWQERWTNKFKENKEGQLQEWHEALKPFSKEQIKKATSSARNKYAWPPSISEFLELCQQTIHIEPIAQRSHLCAITGCPESGSICPEVRGDTWYCGRHYREKY